MTGNTARRGLPAQRSSNTAGETCSLIAVITPAKYPAHCSSIPCAIKQDVEGKGKSAASGAEEVQYKKKLVTVL